MKVAQYCHQHFVMISKNADSSLGCTAGRDMSERPEKIASDSMTNRGLHIWEDASIKIVYIYRQTFSQ